MKENTHKTIVFITGAFVHHSCWDQWRCFFEQKGYNTIVPPWPGKEQSAEKLRLGHPDRMVAGIRLAALTEYYSKLIGDLSQKPILIGHSMGGLITQLLLQRNLAAAGIAIHSLQPQGIFTFKFSFYKAGWPALGFFTAIEKTYLMSFQEWQYAFTNGMDYEEQRDAYYRFIIPESKRVVRDATTSTAKIDFSRPHAPLLFLAGSTDKFIPASLNFSNFKRYSDPYSVTTYKLFEGRNHFVLGQSGWEENANYIASWLKDQAL